MTLIERMSREICKADGFDPDVYVAETKVPPLIGPHGHEYQMERNYVEAWTLYLSYATAALSVINKAKLSEE